MCDKQKPTQKQREELARRVVARIDQNSLPSVMQIRVVDDYERDISMFWLDLQSFAMELEDIEDA